MKKKGLILIFGFMFMLMGCYVGPAIVRGPDPPVQHDYSLYDPYAYYPYYEGWSVPFSFHYEYRHYGYRYRPQYHYQPRHYQPRHYQPRHYQPRHYQPRHYQPRVHTPGVRTK